MHLRALQILVGIFYYCLFFLITPVDSVIFFCFLVATFLGPVFYLGYSIPVFPIAPGIYSFTLIHTAKVLMTFNLEVLKKDFFCLPLAAMNPSFFVCFSIPYPYDFLMKKNRV